MNREYQYQLPDSFQICENLAVGKSAIAFRWRVVKGFVFLCNQSLLVTGGYHTNINLYSQGKTRPKDRDKSDRPWFLKSFCSRLEVNSWISVSWINNLHIFHYCFWESGVASILFCKTDDFHNSHRPLAC